MGGILGGFRELGYRIALLTDTDPPEQLRAAADILEEVPAGPSSHRVTREAERVTSNARFRVAGERLMRQVRPAVVYQRHEYLFSAGALLAQHFNVPLVLEWNNSMTVSAVRAWLAPGPLGRPFQRFLAPLGARMERDVVRTATLIAAVSRRSAEMAVDLGAPAERVAVVPNAVDVDNVPYPGDLPAGGPVRLGWIGSFGTWHGASMMIRALALLSPSVGAVMVGDGPERVPCQELADQLGVAERIEFTGELPRDSALQRLTECTILVSPHIPFNDGTPFFGSPTKIFEYMALGRPMVVSDLEQLGELVDDGSTGRLVPPEDPAALAAVINDVIALPDRGAAMGRRARQAAESEHRWVCRAEAIHRRLVNAMPLAGALR